VLFGRLFHRRGGERVLALFYLGLGRVGAVAAVRFQIRRVEAIEASQPDRDILVD